MDARLIRLFLFLGVTFGVLAATSAFLITWNEFEHHQLEPRLLRKLAIQSALFAFMVFLVLGLLAWLLWLRTIGAPPA